MIAAESQEEIIPNVRQCSLCQGTVCRDCGAFGDRYTSFMVDLRHPNEVTKTEVEILLEDARKSYGRRKLRKHYKRLASQAKRRAAKARVDAAFCKTLLPNMRRKEPSRIDMAKMVAAIKKEGQNASLVLGLPAYLVDSLNRMAGILKD